MGTIVVITDTSVLVNFLMLDQAELLARLPGHRFVVTEHVRAEITDHYQEQLRAFGLQLTLHSTESIVLLLIQYSVLTIAAADAMKLDWEQNHRFRLPFGSFSERVSSAP